MTQLLAELEQQPQSFRDLIDFYTHQDGLRRLDSVPGGMHPLLAGMGASYHAAWVAALHLHTLGLKALALEATDLLNYSSPVLGADDLLIYISQSGSSGEVAPVIQQVGSAALLAVTNDPGSPLAQKAGYVLPLLSGVETLVASKTYLNSIAVLWLLCRRLGGIPPSNEASMLQQVLERCTALVQGRASSARWLETLSGAGHLFFVGHGPHAATARQAAMLVSEWAKMPALSISAGGLRHGFIESTGPGAGIVLFASPGRSQASALRLAEELRAAGSRVMLVSNGAAFEPGEVPPGIGIDEFLSPLLDIIPVQLFVDEMAARLGVAPGFRHIQKVVTKL
ncbi:MAG: SIS domain-containing protein [Chloroflexota bacterium]|nr:MAG: SIS domain-containing protein [Chloroflexota bacterium]